MRHVPLAVLVTTLAASVAHAGASTKQSAQDLHAFFKAKHASIVGEPGGIAQLEVGASAGFLITGQLKAGIGLKASKGHRQLRFTFGVGIGGGWGASGHVGMHVVAPSTEGPTARTSESGAGFMVGPGGYAYFGKDSTSVGVGAGIEIDMGGQERLDGSLPLGPSWKTRALRRVEKGLMLTKRALELTDASPEEAAVLLGQAERVAQKLNRRTWWTKMTEAMSADLARQERKKALVAAAGQQP